MSTVTETGSDGVATDPGREPDLVLAHVHLRLGSLALARTELETMAGRGTLDDEGLRDLAEARWRTGDLDGAGEAAAAWLETRPDDILGLVIAAEAQVRAGRPGEARRLAGRAMERAEGSLDPIFAGMPRSSIWPIEPGSAAGPAGVLFDDLHPGPYPLPERPQDEIDVSAAIAAAAGPMDGPSLWGDDAAVGGAAEGTDAATLVRRARAALDADHPADAAAALLLALRASPPIAPAVLDLLAGRSEPILAVIRGDASRIVGHEIEAIRDHAAAAATLEIHDDRDAAVEPTLDSSDDEPAEPAEADPAPPDQEDS